jgi:serine/threonine-protein kinase
MRSVAHPSVVPLVDVIADGPALVLAWMSGGTLEDLLRAGPLPPARAVEVADAVLSALGEAHRLGILHRDVKPANVLFDDSGAAHLSDFGVAHLGDVSTTATAAVFGTLAYMSPEQRSGRPATIRSDLFAVGVLLREAITGERPAPTGPPRLPSDAHQELDARHDAVVACLTADDPADRPADAFEARARLGSLPWPMAVDPTRTRPRSVSDRAAPGTERVVVRPHGAMIDAWTGRAVEAVPLTERVLARARPFAVAGHPALQSVWRVDDASQSLWLEALPEAALARPLTAAERARLVEALRALHAAGGVHGRVDAAHLVHTASGLVLRFEAGHDPTATADRDLIALARL